MPAEIKTTSIKAPYSDKLADENGFLSRIWQTFFIKIQTALTYLGIEYSFILVNNQAVAAAITDLKFDYQFTSAAFIEYFIQRVTSTTELVQTGKIQVVWLPDSATWALYWSYPGTNVGVTFSITADGQVKYTSTNVGGTPEISRMVFRKRELAGKTSLYSKMG